MNMSPEKIVLGKTILRSGWPTFVRFRSRQDSIEKFTTYEDYLDSQITPQDRPFEDSLFARLFSNFIVENEQKESERYKKTFWILMSFAFFHFFVALPQAHKPNWLEIALANLDRRRLLSIYLPGPLLPWRRRAGQTARWNWMQKRGGSSFKMPIFGCMSLPHSHHLFCWQNSDRCWHVRISRQEEKQLRMPKRLESHAAQVVLGSPICATGSSAKCAEGLGKSRWESCRMPLTQQSRSFFFHAFEAKGPGKCAEKPDGLSSTSPFSYEGGPSSTWWLLDLCQIWRWAPRHAVLTEMWVGCFH